MKKFISALAIITVAVMLFTTTSVSSVFARDWVISPTASTIAFKDPRMMENHHYPTDHVIFTPEGNKGIFTYIGDNNVDYWIHNLTEIGLVENVDFIVTDKGDKLIIEFLTDKAQKHLEDGDYIIDCMTTPKGSTATTSGTGSTGTTSSSPVKTQETNPVSPDTGSLPTAPIAGAVALAGAGAVVLFCSKKRK